jgi:hypothetical protein
MSDAFRKTTAVTLAPGFAALPGIFSLRTPRATQLDAVNSLRIVAFDA